MIIFVELSRTCEWTFSGQFIEGIYPEKSNFLWISIFTVYQSLQPWCKSLKRWRAMHICKNRLWNFTLLACIATLLITSSLMAYSTSLHETSTWKCKRPNVSVLAYLSRQQRTLNISSAKLGRCSYNESKMCFFLEIPKVMWTSWCMHQFWPICFYEL